MNSVRPLLSPRLRRYLYALLALVIFAGAVFFAYRYTVEWQRYTDTMLGISFEYPTSEVTPLPEGTFGQNISRLDNDGGDTRPVGGEYFKMIFLVTTDVPDANSIEGYVAAHFENTNGTSTDSFSTPRYATVDGQKIAIAYIPNRGGGSTSVTEIFVLRNKHLQSISIVNLSPTETERVWKSLRFFEADPSFGEAPLNLPPLTPEEIEKYGMIR